MATEPSIQTRAQLILLGGLPGSGKSKQLERLAADGWTILDDFQKHAINNNPAFTMSQHLPQLLEALHQGRRCVVADVRFVTAEYRDQALRAITGEFPAIGIELRIFERDDAQCAENIIESPQPRDAPGRLRILAEFGPQHSIPPDAVVLSVGAHRYSAVTHMRPPGDPRRSRRRSRSPSRHPRRRQGLGRSLYTPVIVKYWGEVDG